MAKQNLFIAGKPWDGVEQLEIPLSNADGTAASSTKAKFIETTVEENPATAEDILSNKKAWVNGVKINGGIPSLATTNYELKYTGLGGIDKQPKQTISAGSYLAEDVTVTAPTYHDLTTPGNNACPVTSANSSPYIVNGRQYILNGTLYSGSMETFQDTNIGEADKGYVNRILTLAPPANSQSYPGLFSLARVSSGEGGNGGKSGSYYITDNAGVQNIIIDEIFIRNLTPDVVLYDTPIGDEFNPLFRGSLRVPVVDWKNDDETCGILLIS